VGVDQGDQGYTNPFRGEIVEIVMFGKALDEEEQDLVHCYLRNKASR
jgi:hypothetical protein